MPTSPYSLTFGLSKCAFRFLDSGCLIGQINVLLFRKEAIERYNVNEVRSQGSIKCGRMEPFLFERGEVSPIFFRIAGCFRKCRSGGQNEKYI